METYAEITRPIRLSEFPFFAQIDESIVLTTWNAARRKGNDDYEPILARGDFYVRNGLTPAYYTDTLGSRVFVTSEEFVEGKFH